MDAVVDAVDVIASVVGVVVVVLDVVVVDQVEESRPSNTHLININY